MKLIDLLNGINYAGNDIPNIEVTNISYDSRKVVKGGLFIAVNGYKEDGHKYIPEAIDKGASVAIVNNKNIYKYNIPMIRVKDTREAMSVIAKNYYSNPSKTMVIAGVTGTNGKTTTTSMLNHILNKNDKPSGSLGTLGFTNPFGITSTGFTTPEALELNHLLNTLKKSKIYYTVMEVSSHALSLNRVADINFDVAIFTNLGMDHMDFYKNKTNYLNAKKILFQNIDSDKISIINLDDKESSEIINCTNSKIVTYSINREADYYCSNIRLDINSISSKIIHNRVEYDFFSPITGEYNLSNALASIAGSVSMGVDIRDAINSMKSYTGTSGRLELIKNCPKTGTIFIDYAHTPDAFKNVLSTIKNISNNKNIITVFGCGGDRDKGKRPEMAKIAEYYSDLVIVTSDNPRTEDINSIINDIESGFKGNEYQIIKNRKEAIEFALQKMNKNSIFLILGKGRETYQLVNGQKNYHNDLEIIDLFYENSN